MTMSLLSRLMSLGDPRWHGNGFVQLDLNARQRLHCWHPKHDMMAGHNATMHDHVFDLTSEVLLGKVGHELVEAMPNEEGRWGMYRLDGWNMVAANDTVRRAEKSPKTFLGHFSRKSLGRHLMAAGSTYTFARYQFHESSSEGLTATLMTKSNGLEPGAKPRVLCPRYETPSDARAFKSGPNVPVMWDIVDEAITKMWKSSQARIEACIS